MNSPPEVIIRPARPEEAAELAAVDAAAWPDGLATDTAGFRCRIEAFAAGQLVAEVPQPGDSRGAIVACGSAQRITSDFLRENCGSYNALTDENRFTRSHSPGGEIWQLIGVAAAPAARGLKLGRRLVDQQLETARRTPGIRRIIGFTRPAGYHRFQTLPIEEYLNRISAGLKQNRNPPREAEREATGDRKQPAAPHDPVLAFHLLAGARIVSVHRDFRPNDRQACGYGVLIEYPV